MFEGAKKPNTYPVGICSPKLNTNQKGYVRGKSKVIAFKKPGEISEAPLIELLRIGAGQLIANAIEAELFGSHQLLAALKDGKGRQQAVRNGYLSEQEIQTGIVSVVVRSKGSR